MLREIYLTAGGIFSNKMVTSQRKRVLFAPVFSFRLLSKATMPVVVFIVIVSLSLSPLSTVLAASEVPVSEKTTTPIQGIPTDQAVVTKEAPTETDSAVPSEAEPSPNQEAIPSLQKKLAPTPQALVATSGGQKKIERTNYADTIPRVDSSTGALAFDIPIDLPAGRGAAAPSLNLQYNSQDTRPVNTIGRGWSLSIPEIRRVNVTGSQNLFTDDVFESSLSGRLVFIQTNSNGTKTYGPRVAGPGSFTYTMAINGDATSTWVARNNQGATYRFGALGGSRHDDPANPTKIYRWVVDEISDANSNFVTYSYFKAGGQIYPDSIAYPYHPTQMNAPFSVKFLWQNVTSVPQFDMGFRIDGGKQLSSISVLEDNSVKRQYLIGRSPTMPVLITTITESYQNASGVMTNLPPTILTYPTESEASGWEARADWQFPNPQFLPASTLGGTFRAVEFDGDGLIDFAFGNYILRNTGAGTWTPVLLIPSPRSYLQNFSDEPLDVNSDGLSDFLTVAGSPTEDASYVFPSQLFLNKGGRFETDSAHAPLPPQVYLNHEFSHEIIDNGGVRTMDVNGDGVVDIVQGLKFSICCSNSQTIYLRRVHGGKLSGFSGYSWQEIPWSGMPLIEADPLTSGFVGTEGMLTFADANGDGLVDVLRNPSPSGETAFNYLKVDLNTGSGWNTTDVVPWFYSADFRNDEFLTADVNADGYEDVISYKASCVSPCSNTRKLFLGTGVGYAPAPAAWRLPEGFSFLNDSGSSRRPSGFFVDVNGDSASDFVVNGQIPGAPSGSPTVYLNKSAYAYVPKSIQIPTGAALDISYASSPQIKREATSEAANPKLPIILKVVSSITTRVNGAASTESYRYEDGVVVNQSMVSDVRYRGERAASFGKVSYQRADNSRVVTYYHQGNGVDVANFELVDQLALVNRPYREETFGPQGNLVSRKFIRETVTPLTGSSVTGHWFVSPEANVTIEYTAGISKATAEQFTYNVATGNLSQHTLLGEVDMNSDGTIVDTAADRVATVYTYATWNGGPISGKESSYANTTAVVNYSGGKVAETKQTYDQLGFGFVRVGYETKEEAWIAGNTYAVTQQTYNALGLPITSTDPNNKTTILAYDSAGLYPTSATDPLSFVTSFTYSKLCGLPTLVVDPNGAQTKTIVDGLCRVTRVDISDPTYVGSARQATLVSKETTNYVDSVNAIASSTSASTGTLLRETIRYFDGLGRMTQTRSTTESNNWFSVVDTEYDNLGRIKRVSLPYFSAGRARTIATVNGALYTAYEYDALSRVLRETMSVGTTVTQYRPGQTTITDGNGHKKDYVLDAFGRLIKVVEYNQGATYLTQYSYDAAGRLLMLTDAEGNIRRFTYDGLGRRLTAEDLHGVSDLTYGVWTFAYDSAGNLLTRFSPDGTKITYAYDGLNRVTIETPSNGTNPVRTYQYDACLNGAGRLCGTINTESSESFEYNATGQIVKESKTITSPGTTFVTRYGYDRMGNLLRVVTPDGATQSYTYNRGGYIDRVDSTELGGATKAVVTNYTHNANGDPVTVNYANGVTTTNTYDPTKRYRLTRRLTTSPAPASAIVFGPKVQDLSYEYDAVGNIRTLTDASDTNTKKTATYSYDDLDRLLQTTVMGARQSSLNYVEVYTYSPLGNILTKTVNGVVTQYCYDGSNRNTYPGCPAPNEAATFANPHAATKIGSVVYTYDKNGNQITAGADEFWWDLYGRMSYTRVGGKMTIYKYDRNGERLWTVKPGFGMYYPNQWYNLDSKGVVTKHLFVGDAMVATIVGSGSGTVVSSHQLDHLGGQGVSSGDAGQVVEVAGYSSYGEMNLNDKTGAFQEQRKYIGEERDITGLSYLHARYYDSKAGRFLSQDPVFLATGHSGAIEKLTGSSQEAFLSDPQQLNSFSYGANNPISKKDPNGRWFKDFLVGQQSWPSFVTEIGDTAQYSYSSNRIWKAAMDHPIAAGAGVGIVGGAVFAGTSIAAMALSASYIGGVGTGCVISCGPIINGAQKIVDYTPRFGTSLGTRMNQIHEAIGSEGYKFYDHAYQRIAERNIDPTIVLSTLQKSKPFEYFHEGAMKYGYYDSASKIFVSQLQSTKEITTVINNINSSYISSLIRTIK